jgi:hypothetical protein
MKKEIRTAILIKAKPERVWQVLTDFEEYPKWNPFVKNLSGKVEVGKKIIVDLPGMKFKPTVLTYEKYKSFSWLGNFIVKGLFDGEHRFILSETKEGYCLFEHAEKFNGVLVRIFAKKIDTAIIDGFHEMNVALKKRVEG